VVTLIKVIKESIRQAFQQLLGNKLRSFLSLLGISIGIFCIVGVQAAVDSLKDNIMQDLKSLGSDVVYVSKFSWLEDPHADFLKLLRRPNISFDDYKVINKKVKSSKMASFAIDMGKKTIKYKSNSVERADATCATFEYAEMYDLKFEKGRYFSQAEYHYGANKVILGHTVANELFGSIEPLGKTIKAFGRNLEVIGVLEKSGESVLNFMAFDDLVFISYELGRKTANLKSNSAFGNSFLGVKPREGVTVPELKDDLTGSLRAHRRLRPKEENNFAMNEVSIMAEAFESLFGILNILGIVIGSFAILVGAFSVANIMFVSVKERTSIIGVKKALGAKRYIILLEFLIEATILCMIGGAIGLLMVYGLLAILASFDSTGFTIFLSTNNVIYGLLWATGIGLVSGILPAMQASSMDPVEAMRH